MPLLPGGIRIVLPDVNPPYRKYMTYLDDKVWYVQCHVVHTSYDCVQYTTVKHGWRVESENNV